jgi:glutamate-5-semialdehyde dehydrogenase
MTTTDILKRAKAAAQENALLSSDEKNKALLAMACALEARSTEILSANQQDLAAATQISDVMKDRLRLTEERILAMAEGIRDVASLDDPVGKVLERIERPNGLKIQKISVPIGVVAMIYESRPNVTSDAAALSLKSGNVCVLRCGKEAHKTSVVIVNILRDALEKVGICKDFINILEDTSREGAKELMTANAYVDLLIPRGGAGLIRACVEQATVPCIQTGTGICHIYVDSAASIPMALDIVENAKTSRPSVCNAAEVCLVARSIAKEFLPQLKENLVESRIRNKKQPVELRLLGEANTYITGTDATEQDFDTEFLDYILAIAVVEDVKEAVAHIARHSTHHSEAIVTEDTKAAAYFTATVDAAAVYVNASTRFTDGGEFGLGCEIGISTQKMHARGPMGLRELTTYKYVIQGNGQIR